MCINLLNNSNWTELRKLQVFLYMCAGNVKFAMMCLHHKVTFENFSFELFEEMTF